MSKCIRVGTRESALAVAQSQIIINEIQKKIPRVQFELIKMSTKGDRLIDAKLDIIGGKGIQRSNSCI